MTFVIPTPWGRKVTLGFDLQEVQEQTRRHVCTSLQLWIRCWDLECPQQNCWHHDIRLLANVGLCWVLVAIVSSKGTYTGLYEQSTKPSLKPAVNTEKLYIVNFTKVRAIQCIYQRGINYISNSWLLLFHRFKQKQDFHWNWVSNGVNNVWRFPQANSQEQVRDWGRIKPSIHSYMYTQNVCLRILVIH